MSALPQLAVVFPIILSSAMLMQPYIYIMNL